VNAYRGARWPAALPGLALLVLFAGFVDLARGGITAAPALLLIAYCGLIPWAIVRTGRRPALPASPPAGASGPPYGLAAVAAGLVLVLYRVTLAPTTAMWDTGEYMTVAYTMSLPHPPGNPLFVLLGRTVSLLPIAPTVAMRLNLLAAAAGAASAGFWFLIGDRVLRGWGVARPWRLAGAAAGTLLGATAFTVWNQSVANEKVYTIALLFLTLVSWLALRWLDEPDGARRDRMLVLIAYLLGLGYTNHMAGFLAAPSLAAAVLLTRPRVLLRPGLMAALLASLLVGLTPILTQPVQAANGPPLNHGEISACQNGFHLACTFSAETLRRTREYLGREQYGKPSLLERQVPLSAQAGMWWLYFRWQWLRDVPGRAVPLQTLLASLMLGLGLYGIWRHWQADRLTFAYLGPLLLTVTVLLVWYMNFRYGYSQAPQLGGSVPREVRDRDYFFLWSYSAWGLWAGLGLTGVALAIRGRSAGRPTLRGGIAVATLGFALVPLLTNAPDASRARQTFTRDAAVDVLNSVEPYGVLITNGDNDTYPLWYVQQVEGVRKDVTVAVGSLLGLDWYLRELLKRPVYRYDSLRGPALFGHRSWMPPTKPLMAIDPRGRELFPPYVELQRPAVFTKDSIVVQVGPGVITHDQLAVLQMIKDSFPVRSIYFMGPSGPYARALGLGAYLLNDGLVARLVGRHAARIPGTVPVRLFGDEVYVDPLRALALWNSFAGPAAIRRQGLWRDPASESMPSLYVAGGLAIAAALGRSGTGSEAERITREALELDRAAGLGIVPPGARVN
jgi:hypothetical protein